MVSTLWGLFNTPNLIAFVVIFFVLAIANRQLNTLGVPFNGWFSYAILIPYFIIDKFLPLKWAIAIALIGGLAVGVITGMTFGTTDDEPA